MPALNWIGKTEVIGHHAVVPFHLIRCDPDSSVGDPGTGNLLIYGDNLIALKAALPYYAKKVKCIYIDPPYNTGNEGWVYNDNVNSPEIQVWLGKVVGDEAEDLSRHDKWLCMMYPRLFLLRKFLRDDGVIFISIGRDEYGHLRVLCDEIFGRKNLVELLIWNTEGHTEKQDQVTTVHEYILVYARDVSKYVLRNIIDPNVPEDSKARRAFAENSITKNSDKNPSSEIELPPGFPCEVDSLELPRFDKYEEFQVAVTENGGWISRDITRSFGVRYPLRIDDMIVEDGKMDKSCRVYAGWSSKNKLEAFIENGCEAIDDDGTELSFFLSKNGVVYYHRERRESRYILSVLRNMGTTERNRYELEGMGVDFPYPKPKELIKYLLSLATEGSDLVLDSFMGSGTTAHATLLLNNEDGGDRRFIGIEMDSDVFENATCSRIRKVIEGYTPINGEGEAKSVQGLGSGYRSCSLGVPLFDEFGQIRDGVSYTELAHHVFFAETGEPLPSDEALDPPLIGVIDGTAIYLLHPDAGASIRRDQAVLSEENLQALLVHDGPRVVYAEACLLSDSFLNKRSIRFRQIPYEVRVI